MQMLPILKSNVVFLGEITITGRNHKDICMKNKPMQKVRTKYGYILACSYQLKAFYYIPDTLFIIYDDMLEMPFINPP